MHTELGRIAALSERVETRGEPARAPGPPGGLADRADRGRHRVAFVRSRCSAPGCRCSDAVVFAVGLLVGNVPEGLLPVITLALAVGVRELVARRARWSSA